MSLDTDRPTLRVRQAKRGKSRIVPVHPELQNALASILEFVDVGDGRIIEVERSTSWRWVRATAELATKKLSQIALSDCS